MVVQRGHCFLYLIDVSHLLVSSLVTFCSQELTNLVGKRMFKQWVCHPLADSAKINARLDAVESLNSNNGFQEAFVTHLNKMPDLERLISRIHAGSSRAADFLRVLEGFEQIRDAMDEITLYNEGGGLIGQLLASMPDLKGSLEQWESAFDREKAKTQGRNLDWGLSAWWIRILTI